MSDLCTYSNLYSRDLDAYNLPGFIPQVVDEEYLKNLGITDLPSRETLQKLTDGSGLSEAL